MQDAACQGKMRYARGLACGAARGLGSIAGCCGRAARTHISYIEKGPLRTLFPLLPAGLGRLIATKATQGCRIRQQGFQQGGDGASAGRERHKKTAPEGAASLTGRNIPDRRRTYAVLMRFTLAHKG